MTNESMMDINRTIIGDFLGVGYHLRNDKVRIFEPVNYKHNSLADVMG